MNADELRIDFAMNHEHEMVIDRAGGIAREELDEVEIAMLQGGQAIPRLLRMEWNDMDGNVAFCYPLTGRKLLAHRMQTQPAGMMDYYAILLALVETIDDCKDYMLRPEGFLLQEQTIFTGDRLDDLVLCYVPLRQTRAGAQGVSETVLALAVKWLGYVGQPDGEGMKQIFRHLREEHVSWRALRQTLLRLIGGIQATSAEDDKPSVQLAEAPEPEPHSDWGRSDSYGRMPDVAGGRGSSGRLSDQPVQIPPPFATGWQSAQSDYPEPQQVAGDSPSTSGTTASRKLWMLGACITIGLACVWRFVYFGDPSGASMKISLGLTAIAAAAGIIAGRRMLGGSQAGPTEEHEDADAQVGEADTPAWSWRAGQNAASDASPFKQQDKQLGASELRLEGAWSNEERARNTPNYGERLRDKGEQYDQQAASRGIPLPSAPPEATVWLGKSGDLDAAAGDANAGQWLERQTDGKAERIEVAGSLLIGRSGDGVQYVDAAPGISRVHLEIRNSGESWTAKDVGSRNGSTLNGVMMIPYKTYSLHAGDVMQLAGDKGPKYICKTG
ncbi:DUF6382 domain-containing protein [Paenibacillus aurantiacus]|uniref:DUF6382 domain-containing protein n=1 Tax=Paenibacillus aurantiacus TaxID=1936118 RepID=A0ABV5KHW8_9BACL